MSFQTNCPNCGATLNGNRCEYCGTLFYDFSEIDPTKPFHCRIKNLMDMQGYLSNVTIEDQPSVDSYRDEDGRLCRQATNFRKVILTLYEAEGIKK